MTTSDSLEVLGRHLLTTSSALGFESQATKVEERLGDQRLPLITMVVGEGNHGKSSLINALLGRDVAPVSNLPTTRLLDLYETGSGGLTAELSWRSKQPESVSWEDARRLTAGLAANGDNADDLYQVRWFVEGDWPSRPVVLVDTPGIDQIRGLADGGGLRYAATLYGSERIVAERSAPFQFFYHRADVVLWCVRASRIDSAGSLDALAAVAGEGKSVILLVTAIDQQPEKERNGVVARARRTYPDYILEVLPFCTKGDPTLAASTITALRDLLDRRFLDQQQAKKDAASSTFLAEELSHLASNASRLANGYTGALRLRSDSRRQVVQDMQAASESAQAALGPVFREASRSARRSLQQLADRATDPDQIRAGASTTIDTERLQQEVERIGERLTIASEDIATTTRSLDWPLIKIIGEERSATGASALQQPIRRLQRPNLSLTVTVEQSGYEQLVTDVRWWLEPQKARHELLAKAAPRIEEALDDGRAMCKRHLQAAIGPWNEMLKTAVEDAFLIAYGEKAMAVAQRVVTMQNYLDALTQEVDAASSRRPDLAESLYPSAQALRAATDLLTHCVAEIKSSDLRVLGRSVAEEWRRDGVRASLTEARSGSVAAQHDISDYLVGGGDISALDATRMEVFDLLTDSEIQRETFRQLAPGAPLRSAFTRRDCLSMLRSGRYEAIADLIDQALLNAVTTDREVGDELLRSPRRHTADSASLQLTVVYRRSASQIVDQFRQLLRNCPVLDMRPWLGELNQAVDAASRWLGEAGARPQLQLAAEIDLLQRSVAYAVGPLTATARASEAAVHDAVRRFEQAKRRWANVIVGSFIGWGLAFVLLLAYGAMSVLVWLASFVAFVVALIQRREYRDRNNIPKHYRGPLHL